MSDHLQAKRSFNPAFEGDELEDGSLDDYLDDDEGEGGISLEGQELGHRYVMGNVNCYCPKCSDEYSEREGRPICVLDCDYDLDK